MKNLATFCLWSSVLWKVEFASDEIEYLAKEISKQYWRYGLVSDCLEENVKIWNEMNLKIWKILSLPILQKKN